MSQSIDLRAEPRRHLAWGLLGALALVGLAACKQDAGSAPSPQISQVEVITATPRPFQTNRSLLARRKPPVRSKSDRR